MNTRAETETWRAVHHDSTYLAPYPASVYGEGSEIAAVRNHGKDTARLAGLLAAAPTLLSACEGFIKRWEALSNESANLMMRRDLDNLARAAVEIRAAIAKARGT